jgi:hypothetical protein
MKPTRGKSIQRKNIHLKIRTTVLVLIGFFSSYGQTNFRFEHKISYEDHTPKNHFVTYQFGYANSFIGKSFGAKGCMSTIGFNPAKFFSNTLVAGIVVDVKIVPGFGVIRCSNEFRNDFNSNFVLPQGSSVDSVNASLMSESINMGGIQGNYMFYGGVMFSLLPHRAGGLMLQIKRGGVGFEIRNGVFGNPFINDGNKDKAPFSFIGSWRFDLTIKPSAFFTDSYIDISDMHFNDVIKALSLTVFYERFNFQTGEFNKTSFASFLTPEFLARYSVDSRCGIKLGIALY